MIIDSIVAEAMILSSAIEDYRGLCDVILQLDGIYPAAPLGEKYDAADAAIRSLLTRKWIVLYRAEFGPGGERLRQDKLSGELVDQALRDPASWHPALGEVLIELGSTKAGEKAYQAGELPFPQ